MEDEPASVRTLVRLGDRLIAIHGQSSEQELGNRRRGARAARCLRKGAEAQREATAGAAARWQSKQPKERLETLEASRRDREAQARDAGVPDSGDRVRGRPPRTETRRSWLSSASGSCMQTGSATPGETALAALSEDEGSAADRIGEAVRAFAELAAIDPRETAHREEAEDLKRRIADLAAAARDAAGAIEANPERLTALESRFVEIGRLKTKHGPTVAAILERLAALRAEHGELADIGDALGRRRKEEAAAARSYGEAAAVLSDARRRAAGRFSSAVERQLQGLALEKARIRVALEPVLEAGPRASGAETADFLFAPNPGEPEKPLEKIASGGELSRLQLAIRSVAAGRTASGRTLVFDEVDAGIGGRVAEVVGKRLRDLAAHDQVLCVTHVPQIAALADRHYLAEKRETRGRTVASVRQLEGSERVAEIARMLAGEKVPDTALRHARTLLAGAQR